MRVVHVTQFFSVERGYQEFYLTAAQRNLGHEVFVLCSRLKQSPDLLLEKRGAESLYDPGEVRLPNGVVVKRMEASQISTRLFLHGLTRELARIEAQWIIVHGVFTLLTVQVLWYALTRRFRRRITIDDHLTALMRRRSLTANAAYWLFRTAVTPILRRKCRDYIAVTPETVDILHVDLGIPTREIRQISLGADPHRFRPAPDVRMAMRKELGFSDDAIIIVYAGRVEPAKCVVELAETFCVLRERHPTLALLLVGSGSSSYCKSVQNALKAGKLESGTWKWLNWVPNEELAHYLCSADIGVWPGNESIVHLEAMACGLPIVIRNLGSLSDRIECGNGLATDGTVSDIAEKIEVLIGNRQLREEMGRLGRAKVEGEFCWSNIALRFEAPGK